MPYTSKSQQRAMYAAAAGHSTLGIPKKVGAEFVAAGPASAKLPETAKSTGDRGQGMANPGTGFKGGHEFASEGNAKDMSRPATTGGKKRTISPGPGGNPPGKVTKSSKGSGQGRQLPEKISRAYKEGRITGKHINKMAGY